MEYNGTEWMQIRNPSARIMRHQGYLCLHLMFYPNVKESNSGRPMFIRFAGSTFGGRNPIET